MLNNDVTVQYFASLHSKQHCRRAVLRHPFGSNRPHMCKRKHNMCMQAVVAEASACRCVQDIKLHVNPHNAAAVQLYRQAGFVPEAEPRRDYYGSGRPALVMILPLSEDG